ncbi:unnamed protein product, partial [Nesidiocoris tenuis]
RFGRPASRGEEQSGHRRPCDSGRFQKRRNGRRTRRHDHCRHPLRTLYLRYGKIVHTFKSWIYYIIRDVLNIAIFTSNTYYTLISFYRIKLRRLPGRKPSQPTIVLVPDAMSRLNGSWASRTDPDVSNAINHCRIEFRKSSNTRLLDSLGLEPNHKSNSSPAHHQLNLKPNSNS